MEVILLERIEKLGHMGDVVKVKTGYTRNYLLPQKKALRSTKENLAYFESKRAELEARNQEYKAMAERMAEEMKGLEISLVRQASESGQLYGSVTARDIYEALKDRGHKVERRQIDLAQPIKMVGVTQVRLVLHPDVAQTVKVTVARSQEESVRLSKDYDKSLVKAVEETVVETPVSAETTTEPVAEEVQA